jgi:hypothetical protein
MTISANTANSRTINSALLIFLGPPAQFCAARQPAVAGFVYKLE